MANMNLIGVSVTKLWHVQALAYGDGDGGDGGATKNIIHNNIITCDVDKLIKHKMNPHLLNTNKI